MGRLSGWASGKQWKLRTADGVLTGAGSDDAFSPRLVGNTATIIQADGDTGGSPTYWALPQASNLNLDSSVTFVRTAGADDINISAPLSNIVGGPVSISGTAGDSVTLVSNGVDAWYLVASYTA